MTRLRRPLAAAALALLCAGAAAEAAGRSPQPAWGAFQAARSAHAGAGRRGRSDLLALASHWLGQGNPTPFREAWCRDFVNMILERAGYRLADRSHLAITALRLGRRVREPLPGDLAVMHDHVTFFAGWAGHGGFFGLGGNQSHRVTVARFARRAVIAFVRIG